MTIDKKEFKHLFLFFVIALGAIQFLQAQVPSFRQISLKQGLPQSEITTLYQDSRGIIWVGTRGGGLVQFNGEDQSIINAKSGLSNDFIADVQETEDKKLAVGVSYAGIQLLNNRHVQTIQNVWPGYSELRKVAIAGNDIYGICDQSIFKLGPDSSKTKIIFSFNHPLQEVHAHGIIGNRWILASEDSGLWVIDLKSNARSILLRHHEHLNDHRIVGINKINETEAVLVSDDGYITLLDFQDKWPILSSWEKIQNCPLKPGEKIKTLVFGLGQHVKWFATTKLRVLSANGEMLDLTQSVSNLFHSINCLLVDRNGSIWIGTQGSGVIIKPAHSGYSFENFPALMNTNLKAVYVAKDGRLLAGGKESGLLVKRKSPVNGKEVVDVFFPGLNISAIGENQKHFFVGTDKGFLMLDKETFKLISSFSEPGRTILFKTLPNEDMLIGTFGQGAWKLDGKKRLSKIPLPGADPRFVYGFEEFKKGFFYIPSNSGLWILDLAKMEIRPETVPKDIGSLFFLSTTDIYGNFWFSTPYGLATKTPQGWKKWGVQEGLSSHLIYTLNADDLGHIWIGTNQGLDRMSMDNNNNLVEIKNFGPEEGFEGYEANMRASDLKNQMLYVCTIQGLFTMPVRSKILDPLPPKPEITGLKCSFRNGFWSDTLPGLSKFWFLTDQSGIKIDGKPVGLSVSYNAINPVYPNKLKYQYKFEGSELGWSALMHEREALIVDPGSGTFNFLVRTSYDGITFSQPSKLGFSIVAPWYLRTWALILEFLLVVTIIIFASRALFKAFSDQRYFRQDVDIPEKTSQIILLIFSVFYPVTQFIASRFESHVYLNPAILAAVTLLIFLFFISTLFVPLAKKNIRTFLILSFLLFIADTIFCIFKSNMAPYHVVALLYISSLAFLVFNKYWQIIAFGLFLNGFAFYCQFHFDFPIYSPVPFQMGTAGLSFILFVIHMAKQSGEEKLVFANKVVNSGPVLVLGFRFDGTLVFSSENISEILGYQSWEVAGRLWWSHVVGRNEDVLNLLKRIQDQKESELKVYLKTKAGELKKFQFAGRVITQDMLVLLGQDITDREALETRFENLVENAPDAIYQTDFHGKLVYANPKTSFILGISNQELIGRNYTDFLRPDVKESVINFYREQTQKRIPSTYYEFPVVTQMGQVRWLGFQVSLLMSEGGKVIDGYLSIGRDITERLEAEQLIQYQHKNITDSVTYASRIKSAILPGEAALKALFTHVAVYNKPKDIIGGDFYWMGQNGKKYLFAFGDCTGHGVPGAFMTTISVGLLRETLKEDSNWNVEELLGLFNRSLVKLLGSNSEIESPDFVEMALLSVDFENNKIQFISSGIGLHVLSKGEFTSYQEGSRGQNYKYDYRGLGKEISIQPGDVYYLFTDGMFDQLGGPKNKRLTKKGLLEIIRNSNQISLTQGIEEIKTGIETWQDSFAQIDDRLLISFRF